MEKFVVNIYLHGKVFYSEPLNKNSKALDAIINKNKYSAIRINLNNGGNLILGDKNIQDAIFEVMPIVLT